MKLIKMKHGFETMVDDIDFDVLSGFSWRVYRANGGKWRVNTTVRLNSKYISVELPRVIMFPPRNMVVDHKDGNTLDNRRSNLRICTHIENLWNQKVYKNHSTGLKGIYFDKNKWSVRGTMVNGKRNYLGRFCCPLLAKMAYDKALVEHHGEFANFG